MVDWVLSEMGLRLARGSTAAEKKPVGRVAQSEPQTGKPHAYNGYIPNKESKMATQTFSPFNNIEAWDDVMGQMIAFVNDTNADIDMAYDWVCEMLDISSFVDNEIAWNSFYNNWESCDNRNDLNTFQIV